MIKYLDIQEVELLTGREVKVLIAQPDTDWQESDLAESLDYDDLDLDEARFLVYNGSVFDTEEFENLAYPGSGLVDGWLAGLAATYFSGWVIRQAKETDDPYIFEIAWYQE